jgi:hypothetical protein
MPEIIEDLAQAYINARTKDIEDATYRTVWFHMGKFGIWLARA